MNPEQHCAALNHSWVCIKDGYYCPTCNRSFPLGIWAKVQDSESQLMELAAKASCPRGSCEM